MLGRLCGGPDMNLPSTIKHPEGFRHSPAAGYDGVFDWSWTQGCFGEGRITPMDFDGVVERKGNFILFETKNLGVPIPQGQLFTLKAAHALGCFTVFLIHGKTSPETVEIWYPGVATKATIQGKQEAAERVAKWYEWANNNPRRPVDVSLLNKRVQSLIDENEQHVKRTNDAVVLIKQALQLLSKGVS